MTSKMLQRDETMDTISSESFMKAEPLGDKLIVLSTYYLRNEGLQAIT